MIIKADNLDLYKQQALQWASGFEVCCCLDSNSFKDTLHKFDCLIAAGVRHELTVHAGEAFAAFERFREKHPGWLIGFFCYDLKNEVEALSSANPDNLSFPDLYFFEPEHVLIFNGEEVEVLSSSAPDVLKAISLQNPNEPISGHPLQIRSRFNKIEYINAVNSIKQQISRGDVYVTNFCQEFYAENAVLNPLDIFCQLNKRSPNPFAAFFKRHQHYIIGASPERFLAKRDNKLISQPIKGTAKRGTNAAEDDVIKAQLKNNPKEQQENVMIVDLVRNDLTRSAKEGTVATTELFGIYTFEHIFQMISTIECEVREGINNIAIIKNTFPMGSMTGAPKISAMQLMEKLERTKRGVYSGALGYFSPDGDFDFNVVIRSILYNGAKAYLSFQAGSAITSNCDAEKEYEECLLKAQAIFDVLKTIAQNDIAL